MACYIFECVKQFKQVFQLISDLTECVNLELNEDGIYIQSMDTLHVCLISLHIRKYFFEEVSINKDIIIGLNVNSFLKILKFAKSEDKISIVINEDDDCIMHIEIEDSCMFVYVDFIYEY